MAILTREQVIRQNHFERVEVDVSEWGDVNPETGQREKTTVFVRELSAREKDKLEDSLFQGRGKHREMRFIDMRAKTAIMVCVDADGNPVFKQEDLEWLTNRSARPLHRIYDAAMKLNGYSEEDEEELLKN
jgi:hypothetical protein